MAKVRSYYAEGGLSAAFYDVVTAGDPTLAGDIDLYAALAPPGGEVLELGAGSGRVAQGLAERGLTVTGIDLSAAMLARAEVRRAGLPPEVAARIALKRGDMTALDLKRTFDAVLCPFFTLAHVPAGAAWKNTFATAARHLPSGGLAAFHLPKLEVMRGLPPVDPARPVFDQPLPDGGRLRLFVKERAFREPPGRLEQVVEYVVFDPAGRPLQRSPERLTYWMADPEPLAAAAGLLRDRPPQDLGGAGDVWVFRKP
ncbi:class I SAM-dependent methyltransferase [Phenylobacterium sp.]|uniref:class I SAM-dependent methyltransferase n=1 Tax=Phenylobacterium sp. TaxID=1871053 RepID=UPI002810E21D|nr:class I SAM-dependent methyltransferase [Phenylobacterium sp.]